MKKSVLLFVGLTIMACSKDETNDDPKNQTFLESFDGVGFLDQEGSVGFYFQNSEVFLKYYAYNDYDETICGSLRTGQNENAWFDDIPTTISIISNESNTLLIEETYIEDGTDFTETIRFMVNPSGNQLTLTFDEEPDEMQTFTRTEVVYTSLCN